MENLHFNLAIEPLQVMPRDIFCSVFVLYLARGKKAFPLLLTRRILQYVGKAGHCLHQSLLNDSAHNTTSSPHSWKSSHQNPCHAAVLQKWWLRHRWSVQKILNSRRERKWKAACLAPSWVWKLWKVYIPLHKEREQEAMKEKSHYVEMVTFSGGYTGQMSISQKNVSQSLGKETESSVTADREKGKK